MYPVAHAFASTRQRCDATRPICQRCLIARYQDQCVYDATPLDAFVAPSPSQARRLTARRTSSLGETPHESFHLLSVPHPSNKGKRVSRTPSFSNARPALSTPFPQLQPLQKRADVFQPQVTHSHYRSNETNLNQKSLSHPPNSKGEDQAQPMGETSVILRTTALVPSSPLLKSTVPSPPVSREAVPDVQADPTSPYYTFQDTRLIPNPIVRIFMANETNPRMFSLQNISPDTLSLLL